ncbi:MAG: Glycosyl transferase family 2 [Candidatus Magasanikbacteria bacterium GW2011_GWA2_37_8]|uniref:Glycosyl transferase family 2 n=1 Tax=Candidatus Magasanikbacteria bacterium GW2011_GWA2_37_8 TaxID=1619036 RepID=A0A0G0JUR3_9BACT|nr:MAG: Glycosyl transferase family 2 [Candidatus Magasanikbacteria bacterium GW2011_GWA2_37_8]
MQKITIAIPAYNRKDYLIKCLESILHQTFQDFEIIIFDNHSDYNIANLINQFCDSRISFIQNDANVGQLGNFNKVVKYQFNSPYVMIFHDDDTMHPQLLERTLKVLENNYNLLWVGTNLRFVHDSSDMDKFKELPKEVKFSVYNSVELTRLLLNNFHLAFDTVLYRTNCMIDSESFSLEYNKWFDRPFLVELSKKGEIGIIDEPLVNYRMHPGQVAKTDDCKIFDYIINLFKFYFNSLPKPLTKLDEKLFFKWSTNNLLQSASNFSSSLGGYINLLKKCSQLNLFKFSYINARGLYYFLKAFIKFL